MIVYPNAKINLGLNILKKREDGYHDISSVFYPVKECVDILEIIKSEQFEFTNSGIEIPEGENLCDDVHACRLRRRTLPSSGIAGPRWARTIWSSPSRSPGRPLIRSQRYRKRLRSDHDSARPSCVRVTGARRAHDGRAPGDG